MPGIVKRPVSAEQYHSEIESIGAGLTESLKRVVAGLPGSPLRPQELARKLKLNKDLSSRLLRALSEQDRLVAMHLMPGPEPLHRFLRAAARFDLPDAVLGAADRAVGDYEALLRDHLGSRAALDAIIGVSLPDARERFETFHKQAVHRSMSCLKGVVARTHVLSAMLFPGDAPDAVGAVMILGLFGLRRLRPGVPVQFYSAVTGVREGTHQLYSLSGDPADLANASCLLPEFSSCGPHIQQAQAGNNMVYSLHGDAIGPHCAVDIVTGEIWRGVYHRYQTKDPPRSSGFTADIDIPAESLIFDVRVHRDVYPNVAPELLLYDTAIRGIANPNDRSRDRDRLDLAEKIEQIGHTAARRIADVPNYPRLIAYACERIGFSEDEFRCYRCRVKYPLYGSQTCMAFLPPPKPLVEPPNPPELK
jgi:hypothetical protein